MGRKPIENLSSTAVNFGTCSISRLKADVKYLFFTNNSGHTKFKNRSEWVFFFPLAPKANSAYIMSFPSREEHGSKGLVLILAPYYLQKEDIGQSVVSSTECVCCLDYVKLTCSSWASGDCLGVTCSCPVQQPTMLFIQAQAPYQHSISSSQGPHNER